MSLNAKFATSKVRIISVHLYCGSMVGGQKNTHETISCYNIIENSQTSLDHNFVAICPNDFKFGTETNYIVLKAILVFEKNYLMTSPSNEDHNYSLVSLF